MRAHPRFFLWFTLAGLALRIFFLLRYPAITDDSREYIDLATNWLQHGIYAQTNSSQLVPTDTRLPGYPAFLAVIFGLFGVGNTRAVLVFQILFDIATCFAIADLARRTLSSAFSSSSAPRIAFALAATCPFLANYSAAVLTETLEIFFTALALDSLVSGFDLLEATPQRASYVYFPWITAGASIAACILLRPDGGILLAAIGLFFALKLLGFYQRKPGAALPRGHSAVSSLMLAGCIVAIVSLAPLIPWTVRNFRVLHHFQPLAPRYATDTDETTPRGFNLWVKTWMAEYVSVQEIYWNVPGIKIDPSKLPARALDGPTRDTTLAIIADYNESQDLTPELDQRFQELAMQRIRAHPFRYYVELPLLRIADMWLRPRTELLPPDPRWWEFNDDPLSSAVSISFGLLSLFYVLAALLALIEGIPIRYLGLFLIFLLLRSAFLGTLENPEPRYTLECYPVLLLFAAAFLAAKFDRRSFLARNTQLT